MIRHAHERIGDLRQAAIELADRDLAEQAPAACRYRLTDAPIDAKTTWTAVERDVVDFLVRSRSLE